MIVKMVDDIVESNESKEILPWPSCILLSTYLDSIKKGRKIQKGKNQIKSKDIAVGKLHTTIPPYLTPLVHQACQVVSGCQKDSFFGYSFRRM